MKKYIISITGLLMVMIFSGCLKEDYFGISSNALVTKFEVLSQIGDTQIDTSSRTIIVEMAGPVLISHAVVKKIEFSSFASSDIDRGTVLDLSKSTHINVVAEDGTEVRWKIEAITGSGSPQIRNSHFNQWFQTSSGYFEPAISSEVFLLFPVWSTNNAASSKIGVIPVIPFEIQNNNLAGRIETMDNGNSSGVYGRISPGKIFTGKFNKLTHKKAEPGSGLDKGIEFNGRPSSFEIKYQYQPGPANQDRNGTALGLPDAAEIYVFLEVRDSSQVLRLATAWFRSQTPVQTLTELDVDFKYGRLNNSFPDYLKPENDAYVSADSVDFVLPTHLTFMATSSFMGDSLAGAVGSVLMIDDLKLQY
jgi:hypothetical protein